MADSPPVPSPIQVVLNAESFVEDWKREGGGESTDFFVDQDVEFAAHKQTVLAQVAGVRDSLVRAGGLGVDYVKVSVRPEALAKSHRPVRALFKPDRTPPVGGGAAGELIFEVTAAALNRIAAEVNAAEAETRYKQKFNKKQPQKAPKLVANPSRPRSEVGAIRTVELWNAGDRRQFSLDNALRWLADGRTGGFYLVELFEAPPAQGAWDLLTAPRRRLFQSLETSLLELGPGLRAARVPLIDTKRALYAVWLLQGDNQPVVYWDPIRIRQADRDAEPVDLNRERHHALLQRLDRHPLVKRVYLPPVVERKAVLGAQGGGLVVGKAWVPPPRQAGTRYPRVAVVDGGLGPCLDTWIIDQWPLVATADESLDHGTFIGGLLVAGASINEDGVFRELDGCDLVDVKLLPADTDPGAFARYYGMNGPLGFLAELKDAVGELRQRTGVRIFNLSANFQTMADPTRYNPLTSELDAIAEAHDVLFVISAGNADGADTRAEWPADPVAAMAILAVATQDRLRSPAESIRNVSVGALNPPHLTHVIGHAPAPYSRRGPGLTSGLKPDVAHVGGAATQDPAHGTGLWSIDPTGGLCNSAGTSYATPLVAKTLASIANGVEGEISRETLVALLVHHSSLPDALANPAFGAVARHLVGFGLPADTDAILLGSEQRITLVFAARLKRNTRLEFPFSWPTCLTSEGGRCKGYAQMTLVATPPLDPRAEAEIVRVDVQAHLKQGGVNGAHLSCGWLPSKPGDEHHREVRLVAEALKWSAIKIYQWRSPRGQGKSSEWRLSVDHLGRDEGSIPAEGVPFTVILTIADLDGEGPVFNDMRQSLQALGVELAQIQTAARVVARV